MDIRLNAKKHSFFHIFFLVFLHACLLVFAMPLEALVYRYENDNTTFLHHPNQRAISFDNNLINAWQALSSHSLFKHQGYAAGDEYKFMMLNRPSYGPIIFGNYGKQLTTATSNISYDYGTGGIGLLFDTPLYYTFLPPENPLSPLINAPLRLGVGVTYAQTGVKTTQAASNKFTANSTQFIAYGIWNFRWVFLDGRVYFGLNNYRTKRFITGTLISPPPEANGKFAGLQSGARIRGGLSIPICTVYVVPFGELQYTHLTLRHFTETGTPGFLLTTPGRELNGAQGAIGVKLIEASEPESFLPELHIIWLNTYKNRNLIQNTYYEFGGPAFVAPVPIPRNGIQAGGSITARLSNASILNIGYDIELRNRYSNNIGYLKIRIEFLGGCYEDCGCSIPCDF